MNRTERRAAEKRNKKLQKKIQAGTALSLADQNAYVQMRLSQALADHKAGELISAEKAYREVIDLKSDLASAHNALGAALNAQGRPEEALKAFEAALAIDPNFQDAKQNRANLLSLLGQQSHQTFGDSSDSLDVLFHQANQLKASGQPKEAAQLYSQIIQNDPKHARAYANLGDTFIDLRNYGSAAAMCQAALLYDPENAATYNTLGTALAFNGQLDDSLKAFEQSLTYNPANIATLTNLGNAYKDRGDIKKAISTYREALDIAPKVDCHSNILLAMHYDAAYSQEDIYNEHRKWNEAYALPLLPSQPRYNNEVNPEKKLNIALLSASFKRHPVGYMTIAALEALPRENLHLTLYSNTGDADDLTARFEDTADRWDIVAGMNDDALAEKVRNDKIDIFVDLAGHSDGIRLMTFARKPAPVQVKWVGGQINTTGMDAMDYFLSDAQETPEGVDKWYTEEIIRMSDGYVCYDPPFYAPDVVSLPARDNDYITFGCFNNMTKITPQVAALWSEIMKRVPNSRILLKSKALNDEKTRKRYLSFFTESGIDAVRVDLRGSSPHHQLLATYGEVDIALDPFPYSGGLTTVEALYMGVPVITMPGETFAARHAASHIYNVGLQDWIVGDKQDYVDFAVSWMDRLDELATLRATLRSQVLNSPLCDAARFAQNLESALRTMWKKWCSEQS